MNDKLKGSEDPRLSQIIEVIFKFAAGDLTARGTLSNDDSALDRVMAGINILGEKLEAYAAENQQALEYANTLIRSSPDGVLAVDLDLRITEWNLLMERMCGKSREQKIGQDLAEIPFMKETGEGARIREGLEGKSIGPREVAYRIPGEDTERFFGALAGVRRRNPRAVLRVRDITERKRMADASIENENRLRTVLESVQSGIVIIDPEMHRIVDVNTFAARMIGAPKENIVGTECHKFICPAERGQCPFTDLHQTIDHSERVLLTAAGERREIIKTVTTIQLGGRPHLLESFIDITERKRADLALTDSEAQLTAIFNATQDGILMADAQTRRFRMANTSMCRMLGYSHDELLNLTINDIHPEKDLPDVARQFEGQLKGEINVATLPIKRKDGTVFHAEVTASPVTLGGHTCMVGVFRDITERKQTELTLRQGEHFLDTLLNAIPVPIFYKDREGRYLGFNKAYETFFGATKDQLIGKSVFDISPPELAKIYHAKDTELYESRGIQQYESQIKDRHGSLRDVIFSKAVFTDSQGVVSGLIGVILDITERKHAEHALVESQALLSTVFDSVLDGIVLVDAETRQFLMSNTSFQRMLGYSADEILGLGVADIHPKEEMDNVNRQIERNIRGEISSVPNILVKRKDGSIFYADVNGGPMTINGVAGIVDAFRDITERRLAEEKILKLNKSLEKKIRQLLAAQEDLEQHRVHLEQEVAKQTASLTDAQRIAHLGNWEWDIANSILQWSDEMYRIFGSAPQEFKPTYEAFLQAVHPEDRQSVDTAVHDALEQRRDYNTDFRILLPDGSLRYAHGQGEVYFSEGGQPLKMLGTMQDLTVVKLAEQKATDERNFSNTLIASQPDIFYVLDPTGRFIRWNNKLRDLLGYSDSQLAAANALDIIHEEDRPVVAQKTQEAFEQGTATNVARLVTKTGIRDFSLTAKRVDTAKGAYVIGVGTDITERKLMEGERQANEQRLQLAIQASHMGIWDLDLIDHAAYRSLEHDRIFGYESLLPKWTFEMFLDHVLPEDRSKVKRAFNEAVEKETDWDLECRIRRIDGEVRWILAKGTHQRDSNVVTRRMIGIVQDITERKQTEEQIRILNEELEDKVRERTKQLMDTQDELVRKEKLALLGQVAGSVGHELRNPLAVMNNAVYFLQTVLADADETTREYLGIIKTEIADADRIVSDLLDSVRTKPPQPTAVSVGELLDQTLHKVTVPDTITVTLDLPETLPPVWVDGQQIQQVFRNLIGNAVEAMPEGGTLAINAVENGQKRMVSVSVRDTGCGMTQEVLSRLFQPLFTTKAHGIGLGMVVVKNLTEANGGTIMVESAVGQGTTFTVALPMDNPEGSRHA